MYAALVLGSEYGRPRARKKLWLTPNFPYICYPHAQGQHDGGLKVARDCISKICRLLCKLHHRMLVRRGTRCS
jgi:hypothetical protein